MDRRIPLALALAGAAAASLLGCQDTRSEWLGTWRGELTGVEHEDPSIAATLRTVELIVHPDSTFNLKLGPFPVEGNIPLGGTKTTLTVLTIGGRRIESQPPDLVRLYEGITLTRQPDGTLHLDQPNANLKAFVLHRTKPASTP